MLNLKAVIAGVIIGVLGSTVSLFVVAFLFSGVTASHKVFFVGLGFLLALSFLGGYVVARIAGRHELGHAVVAGLPFLLISVLAYRGAEFADFYPGSVGPGVTLPVAPAWHHTVVDGFILLIVPAALAGGYLARARLSQTERRLHEHPS